MKRKPPEKTSRAREFIDPEMREAGQLSRTKRMVKAGVKLFWLKRGSRDEGRDLESNVRIIEIRDQSPLAAFTAIPHAADSGLSAPYAL